MPQNPPPRTSLRGGRETGGSWEKYPGHVPGSCVQKGGAFLGRKWSPASPFEKSFRETFLSKEISGERSSQVEHKPFEGSCSHTRGGRGLASKDNASFPLKSCQTEKHRKSFGDPPTLCGNETETTEHTFSTGRKSFSTSIERGLSFIGLSLKISPKPTPFTFLGWIAAVMGVPLAPSDLVLLESPPSLSEPVVSLKPIKKGLGKREKELRDQPWGGGAHRGSQPPGKHL